VNPIAAEHISTERLDLLPLRVDHAEEMATVLSDRALHSFIGGSPDTAEALRARYQRLAAGSPDPSVTWCNWVIQLRGEGSLTGTLQATISPAGPEPAAEIAWVVGSPWQGRGIATEAARGLSTGSASSRCRPLSPTFTPITWRPAPSPRPAGSPPPTNGTTERSDGSEASATRSDEPVGAQGGHRRHCRVAAPIETRRR
jgi:hypothetical protein